MTLLHDGQKILGTYEVERFIGSGAFAEVYRVRHRFLGRQAMKVFKRSGMTIEETEEVLSEATLLSGLGHPNIVRVFDANTTETSAGTTGFFTMEYVAGGTLERFWRSHGARFVPAETAVDIIAQVCRGLAVAHAETPPIIHRDIKPQNILVGYDAGGLRGKLSDFGLAKRVNPLTLAATALGTRAFKPPEVFSEGRDSTAGDVWALGSVLYLLLTDRLPYTDPSDLDGDVDETRFDRPLIPAGRLNIQVDPALERILFRALADEVEARFASASELLADLVKWTRREKDPDDGTKAHEVAHDSKRALGAYSPVDEETALLKTRQALELASNGRRLGEAADLMEEALNLAPQLRDTFEYRLKLWRRGVVM